MGFYSHMDPLGKLDDLTDLLFNAASITLVSSKPFSGVKSDHLGIMD